MSASPTPPARLTRPSRPPTMDEARMNRPARPRRSRPPSRAVASALLSGALALPLVASGASHDDDASAVMEGASGPLGPAGVFTGGATELEPLTLSVVEPLAAAPYTLDSGGYYRIDVECDGSGELALSGSEFFRAVYVDEVIIEDIEVRPLGLDSLEFDAAGTATISFVAIRPGTYTLSIPGSSGESQRATFTIR